MRLVKLGLAHRRNTGSRSPSPFAVIHEVANHFRTGLGYPQILAAQD